MHQQQTHYVQDDMKAYTLVSLEQLQKSQEALFNHSHFQVKNLPEITID